MLHRDHLTGAGAAVLRATWVKVDPDHVDAGIELSDVGHKPSLEAGGILQASLMVDRATGRRCPR